MTDRPILFSGPMVRAQQEDRKTQTRRILKPQPERSERGTYHVFNAHGGCAGVFEEDVSKVALDYVAYQPDDRLWVRESFSFEHRWMGTKPKDVPAGVPVWYWADGSPTEGDWTKPIVSIHMPRWVSRLTDTLTDVRVQRLQEITEEDAKAEGFDGGRLDDGFGPRDLGDGYTVESPGTYASAAGMFLLAWQKLHPEWDGYSDPWVVALTFSVDKRNIDEAGKPVRSERLGASEPHTP